MRHGRLGVLVEVAELEVEQVLVQGGDAAGADLVAHGFVLGAAELFGRPDDGVAAVVFFEHQGLLVVAQKYDVDVVAFVVRHDVLGVDADPFPRDELLEFVLDVEQLGAADDFVGDQEQLAPRPIVEFVFEAGLVDDSAVGAVDAHDGLEEQVFPDALPAVHDQRGAHLGAGVLDGVGEPLEHPGEHVAGVVFVAAEVFEQRQQSLAGAGLRRGGPAAPQIAGDGGVGAGGVEADLFLPHQLQAAQAFDVAPGVVRADVEHVGLGH